VRINPLFKWFGSKWRSAVRYPAPLHDTIAEPFAGGAGYSLNYCDRRVYIYDTDPSLRILWPWLIGPATSADVLAIPLDVPVGTDIRTIGLSPGQAALMRNWQRTFNRECWTVSVWNNTHSGWNANVRARVAETMHAVKHWKFMPIESYAVPGVTYFVDPPYQYNERYVGGKNFDFRALSHRVKDVPFTSQVIVCEAPHPKTGAIPDWLPFTPNHTATVTAGRRGGTTGRAGTELIHTR
jgi:hypothetical protein